MIRFNKGIEIRTDRNGNHMISTDMGQLFKTSLVSPEYGAPRTNWWHKQHQSELRSWQKDLILGELDRVYRRMNFTWQMNYYLVYEERKGMNQPHDVVFARIPPANIWVLGTANHTWIHHCDVDNFWLYPNTSVLGDFSQHKERDRYNNQVIIPLEKHARKLEAQNER